MICNLNNQSFFLLSHLIPPCRIPRNTVTFSKKWVTLFLCRSVILNEKQIALWKLYNE